MEIKILCQAGAHTVHPFLEVKTLEDNPLWKVILYKILLWWACGGWVMVGTTWEIMTLEALNIGRYDVSCSTAIHTLVSNLNSIYLLEIGSRLMQRGHFVTQKSERSHKKTFLEITRGKLEQQWSKCNIVTTLPGSQWWGNPKISSQIMRRYHNTSQAPFTASGAFFSLRILNLFLLLRTIAQVC